MAVRAKDLLIGQERNDRVVHFGKYSPDFTGATDATSKWNAAISGGGTLLIPGDSTLLLADASIPVSQGDVTIKPLGPVKIISPSSANAALVFNALGNASATVSASAVANETGYPASFQQLISKISIDPATFTVGELCHIMGNDAHGGFISGEYFRVLAKGANYILTNRHLFYSYTTSIVVRRITATPKLTIHKGITFDCSDDVTATIASRGYCLRLRGAVEPDVDVRCTQAYSMAVRMDGCYGGDVRLRSDGLHVDYNDGAYGYGIALYGPCYGTRATVSSYSGGHAVTMNASQTTYNTAGWYSAGAPMDVVVREAICDSAKNASVDCHWAIRPTFEKVVVNTTTLDSDTNASSQFALMLGGIDISVGTVVARNTRGLISLRDCLGLKTRIYVASADHRTSAQGPHQPRVVESVEQTAGETPEIYIANAFIETPGRHPLHNGPAIARAYKLRFGKVVFGDCASPIWYSTTTPAEFEIDDGTWLAGSGGTHGVIRYDEDADGLVTLRKFHVVESSGGNPTGMAYAASTKTGKTIIGEVTSSGGALPLATSNNAGTVTAEYLTCHGRVSSTGGTGGSSSAGSGSQYVEMTVNGTTYKILHDGTV